MTKTIMIIGWQNPKFNVKGISDGFQDAGDTVIRVAADLDSTNRAGDFDYHLMYEMLSHYPFKPQDQWVQKPEKIKTIHPKGSPHAGEKYLLSQKQLNLAKYIGDLAIRFNVLEFLLSHKLSVDEIFIGQCDFLLDMTGLDYWFYYTEDYKPMLPYGGHMKGLFYAFVGGDEIFKRSFAYEFNHATYPAKFVAHGMDRMAIPATIPTWEERPIGIGFKGLLHMAEKARDFKLRYMYDNRRHFVQLTDAFMNTPEFTKRYPTFTFQFSDHTNFGEYITFMLNTKVAINLPGIDGWINQRQYEALGFGCLLLQYYYPELHKLGFINRKNCLVFENDRELADLIVWIAEHPFESAEIAAAGHQLFYDAKMAWQDRALEIKAQMDSEVPETWIDWQNRLAEYENELRPKYPLPYTEDTRQYKIDNPHPTTTTVHGDDTPYI